MTDVTIRLRDGLTYAVTVDPPVVPPVITPPPTGSPLDTIAPGTARQVGVYTPNGLASYTSPGASTAAGNSYGARTAYSGLVFDSALNEMLQLGGEHDNTNPNDILGFSPVTLKWTSRSPCTADRTHANYDSTLVRWISDNAKPAIHTYNALEMLGRKFAVLTNASTGRIAWRDMDTGAWTYSNHPPKWHYDCAACATVDGKVLVASGTTLWLYDPATDTELQLPSSPAIGVTLSLVYYPPTGKYYAISGLEVGATKLRVVEITLGATPTVVEIQTTGPGPASKGYVAMDFDPVNKTIGGMIGEATDANPSSTPPGIYFAFKPETREWRRWNVADPAGVKPTIAFFSGKFLPSGIYIGLSGYYHTPQMMTWAVRPPAWT